MLRMISFTVECTLFPCSCEAFAQRILKIVSEFPTATVCKAVHGGVVEGWARTRDEWRSKHKRILFGSISVKALVTRATGHGASLNLTSSGIQGSTDLKKDVSVVGAWRAKSSSNGMLPVGLQCQFVGVRCESVTGMVWFPDICGVFVDYLDVSGEAQWGIIVSFAAKEICTILAKNLDAATSYGHNSMDVEEERIRRVLSRDGFVMAGTETAKNAEIGITDQRSEAWAAARPVYLHCTLAAASRRRLFAGYEELADEAKTFEYKSFIPDIESVEVCSSLHRWLVLGIFPLCDIVFTFVMMLCLREGATS